MLKIGKVYVLSEAEIEELRIDFDRNCVYRYLAELKEEPDVEEGVSEDL